MLPSSRGKILWLSANTFCSLAVHHKNLRANCLKFVNLDMKGTAELVLERKWYKCRALKNSDVATPASPHRKKKLFMTIKGLKLYNFVIFEVLAHACNVRAFRFVTPCQFLNTYWNFVGSDSIKLHRNLPWRWEAASFFETSVNTSIHDVTSQKNLWRTFK